MRYFKPLRQVLRFARSCRSAFLISKTLTGALVLASCVPALSQASDVPAELPIRQMPTYADLVDLARAADLAAVVVVDEQIAFPPERAPDVAPGFVRLYIEAETQRLLASPAAIGEQLVFVVDQPVERDGRALRLKGQSFLVFGDLVPATPGTAANALQLLSSESMLPAGPAIRGARCAGAEPARSGHSAAACHRHQGRDFSAWQSRRRIRNADIRLDARGCAGLSQCDSPPCNGAALGYFYG